jgi:DNA polymerase III delta prime subunit
MAESLAKGNNPPSEDFLSFPDGGTERTRKLREAYQQLKDFYASLSASSVRLRYARSAVCFVNLAIREGNPSKDKVDVSNFLQATIHGLDQYCSQISKKNIKYKTILTCSGPGVDSGRRYIFSGSPGCGKTTLAHKLTQDLYSEHLSNSYKLILFVELRKLRLYLIQSEGSIGLPLVLKVLGLPEGLSTAIEEQGGEGVALILDGFDEISDDVKMSFWLTHLFSRETLYLNRCDMFVTTRSSQLAKLTDKCREHRTLIEILGFTKKNINSYIRKYPFHSPHKSEEVIQKLESLPLIRGMCSNPRILEILCKLHQHVQEEPLPETLSGTFAKLICHQLEEDLNQRQPPVKVRIRNLLEVPEDHFPGFYQLCEVAYKCCLEQRLIITVEDLGALKQYEDSRGSIYNLLFSEEVESCSPVDGVLYQSDHKTILETLAAAYIGHLRPIREQEGFLKVVLKASHMALVWRMYCGVTGLKFVDIKAVYPLSGRARDVLQTGHVLLGSMDTYITTFDKHDMLLMLSLYEANDRDSANQVLCDILRNFVAVRIDDGYKSAVVTHTISCHPQLERVLLLIEAEWIDSWALKPLIACLAKVKSVALLIPPIEIVLALLSGRVQELWVDWFRMHISNMKVGDLGRNKFPTPKDWRSLADGVKSSSCLQSLRINFPGLPDIDPDACRYVVENISRNKNVAKITIDSPANIPVTENCLQKLFKDRRSVTLNFPIPLVLWSVMLPELKKAKTLNELGLRVVRHKASDMFSNKLRLQTLKGIIMKNKNINHLAITCGDAEDYLQVLKLLSSPSCKHIKGLHLAGTIDVKDIANGHELCDLLLAGPMLRHTCHLCLRLDAVECGLLLSRVHTLKPLEELSIFVTIQSCNSTHKDSTLREVKTSIAKCNLKKLKIEVC